MAKCEKCGRLMNTIHWARGKDMAICINADCAVYRQPNPNAFAEPSTGRTPSRGSGRQVDSESSLMGIR